MIANSHAGRHADDAIAASSDLTAEPRGLPAGLAIEVGSSWALACREELEVAGRPIVDGWPGTMSEARARVASALAKRRPSAPLAAAVLAELVQTTYLTARTTWRSWATR